MGVLEEGEIDSFLFLQGIEDLLSTPLRNIVIEEVFGDKVDKTKASEKGIRRDSEEVEVGIVLC